MWETPSVNQFFLAFQLPKALWGSSEQTAVATHELMTNESNLKGRGWVPFQEPGPFWLVLLSWASVNRGGHHPLSAVVSSQDDILFPPHTLLALTSAPNSVMAIGIFIPIFNPLTCYPCRQPPFTLEFLDMCDHRKGFSNMHEIVYSWTYFFTYDKSSISMSSQLKPWFKKAFK